MEQTDPVLNAMFEGEDFDEQQAPERVFDPKYGAGKWPKAVLTEVEAQQASEFGHSIMLKLNLTPDVADKLTPFAFFVDTPVKPEENGDPDKYERELKIYNVKLNQLKTLVHATGQWVIFNEKGYKAATNWPKSLNSFEDQINYDKLVGVFSQLIGRNLPVNVKINEYDKKDGSKGHRKSVWGLDPKQV